MTNIVPTSLIALNEKVDSVAEVLGFAAKDDYHVVCAAMVDEPTSPHVVDMVSALSPSDRTSYSKAFSMCGWARKKRIYVLRARGAVRLGAARWLNIWSISIGIIFQIGCGSWCQLAKLEPTLG